MPIFSFVSFLTVKKVKIMSPCTESLIFTGNLPVLGCPSRILISTLECFVQPYANPVEPVWGLGHDNQGRACFLWVPGKWEFDPWEQRSRLSKRLAHQNQTPNWKEREKIRKVLNT